MAKPDGSIIRDLRRKRALNQAQLARIAGISEKTLKRIEAGLTDAPQPETMAAIAGALKVSATSLFESAAAARPPAGDPAPALPAATAAPSCFVGRAEQLATLSERLVGARSGLGQVIWVAGEPGAGKSAFLEEGAHRAAAAGFAVVLGRCYESPGAPSFWPWVQVLGELVEGMSADALRRIAGETESELAALLPGFASSATPDRDAYADRDRFRLFTAVARLLRERAREQPLLLILDDLHCADTPSLLLWQALARQLRASPIALLATYRHTDIDAAHPLTSVCTDLLREANGCRISLPGLRPEEIEILVRRVATDRDATPLSQTLFERTEGNPFFVLELVEALRDPSDLSTHERLARLCPAGIREAVQLRLQKLGDDVTHVLGIAAVVGRRFAWRIIEQVSPLPIAPALERAVRSALIRELEGAPGVYEFSHMLFRDALYDQIPIQRRMDLHRAVAETIEARHAGELAPHLTALAYHFLQAGPLGHARGVEFSRVAAEDALQRMAFEEAIRLYHTALGAIEREGGSEPRAICEFLLALADAQNRGGHGLAASASLKRAARIARSLGAGDLLARSALGIGMRFGQIFEVGVHDDAQIALLREALDALPQGEAVLRAQVLALLAMSLFWSGDFESSARLAAEAVDTAERSGHALTQFRTLTAAYLARSMPGAPGREEITDKLQQIALSTRSNEVILHAQVLRTAEALRFMTHLGPFARSLAQLARLAGQAREPWVEWWVLGFRTLHALIEGDTKTAADLTEQQWGLGERADAAMVEATLATHRYGRLFLEGRWEELHELVTRMLHGYPNTAAWPCAAVICALRLGRRQEAERSYRDLIDHQLDYLCQPLLWPACLALLSEVCFEFDDGARARRLEQVLVPHAHENLIVGIGALFLGPASRALGLLAAAQGRFEEARVRLGEALQRCQSIPAPPLALQVEIDLLRLDARAGTLSSGVRARCDELATRARLAGWHGLDWDLRRLRAWTSGIH